MALILPSELPPAATVTETAAIMVDSGAAVEKATPIQIVDAAIPLASQAEAEAGSDNVKRVTSLRMKQAIAAQAVSLETLASTGGAGLVGILGEDGEPSTTEAQFEYLYSAVPDPRRFGVVADGTTNDTAAWKLWITHCVDNNLPFYCAPWLDSVVDDTLKFPILGTSITTFGFTAFPIHLGRVRLRYAGTKDRATIEIGHGAWAASTAYTVPSYVHNDSGNSYRLVTAGTSAGSGGPTGTGTAITDGTCVWDYLGRDGIYDTEIHLPSVVQDQTGGLAWNGTAGTSDYLGLLDPHIGILIRRALRCRIYESRVYGYTKGLELRGCGYCWVYGGHLYDSRYNRVWSTEGSDIHASYSNSNKVFGGRCAHTSATSSLGFAAGDAFTWDHIDSYRGHNDNTFYGVCYEGTSAVTTRPCALLDGVGNSNMWRDSRIEGVLGPWLICDADVTPTSLGGGVYSQTTTYACNNVFMAQFAGMTGQQHNLLQVGGACGNRIEGMLAVLSHWHSGSLSGVISTTGTAARLNHPDLIFVNESTGGLAISDFRRDDGEYGTSIISNRNGVHLILGGYARLMVPFNATAIKDFLFSYACQAGAAGRPAFIGLDSTGAILSGIATESRTNPLTGSAYKDELYIKATDCHGNGQFLVGAKVYTSQGDGGASVVGDAYRITCRTEVKTLIAGVQGTTAAALVKAMAMTGLAAPIQQGSTYPTLNGHAPLQIVRLVDDTGRQLLSSANPATAGKHGYYAKGDTFGNTAAASGQPAGWACTTTGWLAPAWTISTVYATLGRLVTNDTGKVYQLTTAGTSAGSGGPTGTTATVDGITDGTAKWMYIGVLATFAAMGNLA